MPIRSKGMSATANRSAAARRAATVSTARFWPRSNKAVKDEGGLLRFIAPRIGGVSCNNENLHAITDQIAGAPSVLFDAVAILPGANSLADNPAAVDFLSDAFVHCKFIGLAKQASGLMDACGLTGKDDAALCKLDGTEAVTDFVSACRSLRHWPREAAFTS